MFAHTRLPKTSLFFNGILKTPIQFNGYGYQSPNFRRAKSGTCTLCQRFVEHVFICGRTVQGKMTYLKFAENIIWSVGPEQSNSL